MSDTRSGALPVHSQPRIVFAHTAESRPVTAVKNVLVQASLAQIQTAGFYERYSKLIESQVLEQLLSSVGPGWVPIELADSHYAACDRLNLNTAELKVLGSGVGDRLQKTTLVSTKKDRQTSVDVWAELGSLHRMWDRQYQGGSVQVTQAGDQEMLIELRGFVLTRHLYFRNAMVPAIGVTFLALGVRLDSSKISKYVAARDEVTYRLSWT